MTILGVTVNFGYGKNKFYVLSHTIPFHRGAKPLLGQ